MTTKNLLLFNYNNIYPFELLLAQLHDTLISMKTEFYQSNPELSLWYLYLNRISQETKDFINNNALSYEISRAITLLVNIIAVPFNFPFMGYYPPYLPLRLHIHLLKSVTGGTTSLLYPSKLLDVIDIMLKVTSMSFNDTSIYEYMSSIYIINAIRKEIPNFVYIYDIVKAPFTPLPELWGFDSRYLSYVLVEEYINGYEFKVMLRNSVHGSPSYNENDIRNIILQVIFAIAVLSTRYEYVHYDLHVGNVIGRFNPYKGSNMYVEYMIYDRSENKYYVYNIRLGRYIATIIDYSHSRFRKDDTFIYNSYNPGFSLYNPFFDMKYFFVSILSNITEAFSEIKNIILDLSKAIPQTDNPTLDEFLTFLDTAISSLDIHPNGFYLSEPTSKYVSFSAYYANIEAINIPSELEEVSKGDLIPSGIDDLFDKVFRVVTSNLTSSYNITSLYQNIDIIHEHEKFCQEVDHNLSSINIKRLAHSKASGTSPTTPETASGRKNTAKEEISFIEEIKRATKENTEAGKRLSKLLLYHERTQMFVYLFRHYTLTPEEEIVVSHPITAYITTLNRFLPELDLLRWNFSRYELNTDPLKFRMKVTACPNIENVIQRISGRNANIALKGMQEPSYPEWKDMLIEHLIGLRAQTLERNVTRNRSLWLLFGILGLI